MTWEYLPTSSASTPSSRRAHALCTSVQLLFVTAGCRGMTWGERTCPASTPSPRRAHALRLLARVSAGSTIA